MTTQGNTPNETTSAFENLKNLKSVTAKNAQSFQQTIFSAKQRIDAINKAIESKTNQFKTKLEPQQPISTPNVVTPTAPTQNTTIKESPTVNTTPIEKPVEKSTVKNVEKTDETVVKPTQTVNNEVKPNAPKEEAVKSKPSTSGSSTSTNSKTPVSSIQTPTNVVAPKSTTAQTSSGSGTTNASGEKTYRDDKGNIKVRRFLERPQPTPKPQPTFQNRTNSNGNYQGRRPLNADGTRPPYQPRTPNANGTRPFNSNRPANGVGFDKDKDDNRGQTAARPAIKKTFPSTLPAGPQKQFGNKNKTHEKSDDKRQASKKLLLTKTYTGLEEDERMIARRPRQTHKQDKVEQIIKKIDKAIITTEDVSIKVLSEKIGVSVSEIIKQLFKEGIVKTINDKIEFAIAAYIASSFNVELEQKVDKTAEEIISTTDVDELPDDTKRPPIVTVMGHVDHGKTSLLDAIRKTNVTSIEAGGITQHIGAYTVSVKGEQITFIDTPGHAAFTAMRARGAKVTDVAIIVVAADDGVMPQTIEAINHAKAAEVSILVAINKMDKPAANPDHVKQQLAEYGLVSEEWGGDTIMVPVSAKARQGIDTLLESVLLVTEIKELKANPKKRGTGTVIESKLDKGRGPVATILIRNGTLYVGDNVIAGTATGKIRAMFDDKGKRVKAALPSCPVEVLGFSDLPNAGDFMYVADEKLVRKVAEERKTKAKIESTKTMANISLDELYGKISEGNLKNLNLIIKTDVQGSLEALKVSLEKISNDEVKIHAIHGGVGAITETDVMLAKASEAIIIGFNVRADSNAKTTAEREGVDIRLYSIIYDAVDDVTKAMKGMLAPKYKETILGQVTVREVFKISNVGTIAGSYVNSGKIVRNAKVRLYRDNVVVHDGQIAALKRFKDDAKEVAAGYECGVSLVDYNDIKVDDVFEIYIMEEIAQ